MSATDLVGITSTDANAVLPVNAALVNGTKTFSVTLKTAGSWNVTATDIFDPGGRPGQTSTVTVSAGAFTKLQLLLFGEVAAPGTATGKTAAAPAAQTAGAAFNVTVNAVDANWNVVNTITDTVAITTSPVPGATLPPNAPLALGTKDFSITLVAGSWTVTASDVTDPTKTSSTSPSVTVN